MFFGSLIAYCIIIYMYGQMYEDLLEKNLATQAELTDVKKQNESLLQANEDLDEQTKEPLTVQEISIAFSNSDELKLDTFTIHKLEELIKEETDHLIGQDVQIVTESDTLLESAIENKDYEIDDFTYHLDVIKLTLSTEIKITVEIELDT